MRRKFLVIANPGAGPSGSPLLDRVAACLRREGADLTCLVPGDALAGRKAAKDVADTGGYDAIVAAGGDGTIRQVAAALLGSSTPLGVVPLGTGNVLAHEIGLKRNAEAICHTLLHGPAIGIACAYANDEPFLLMAGAGFDGRVIAALDHRFKSHLGKAAYAGPVLGALVRPMDTLSVAIDGHHHEASWAVITSARHYGGGFVLAPHTGILERGLQAVLFKAKSRSVLVAQLMSLATGGLSARALATRDVEMHRCVAATVTAHRPVPVQIDGDAFGSTPLEVRLGAEEVRLIVPPDATVGPDSAN